MKRKPFARAMMRTARNEQLFQAGTISRQAYDQAMAAAHSADANASCGESQYCLAEKLVEQRKAEIQAQTAQREQTSRTAPPPACHSSGGSCNGQANVEAARRN